MSKEGQHCPACCVFNVNRRLVAALQAKSCVIGRYKVRRLMREEGFSSVWKRKFSSSSSKGVSRARRNETE
ncbi:MAG: transposase [Rugosibacter sp.]|nr:MAG: transposase [Rugosibacter sp.]